MKALRDVILLFLLYVIGGVALTAAFLVIYLLSALISHSLGGIL